MTEQVLTRRHDSEAEIVSRNWETEKFRNQFTIDELSNEELEKVVGGNTIIVIPVVVSLETGAIAASLVGSGAAGAGISAISMAVSKIEGGW
jgi:bacteriocin-like protein